MLPSRNSATIRIAGQRLTYAIVLLFFAPSLFFAASESELPVGTRIILQLNDDLSTKTSSEGDSFSAVVMKPVYLNDQMVIPKGSRVSGSISRIRRPGRFKGKAVMNLLFQSIALPGREKIPLIATLVKVDPEGNGGVQAEGEISGPSSTGSDVAKVVAPGIIGTGIGTLAGGGKGAGIGAGIGAAIGIATVVASRGKDIEVSRGSRLEIVLDRSLEFPLPGEKNRAGGN